MISPQSRDRSHVLQLTHVQWVVCFKNSLCFVQFSVTESLRNAHRFLIFKIKGNTQTTSAILSQSMQFEIEKLQTNDVGRKRYQQFYKTFVVCVSRLLQKNWQSDFEGLFKLLIVFERFWLGNGVCGAAVQVLNYSLSLRLSSNSSRSIRCKFRKL